MPTERESQLLSAAYQAGITSQKELAIFMAQVSVESNNLNTLNEGFRYTRNIEQITEGANVRSALREGPEALEAARLEALSGNSERLADLMYGSRMGNNEPGDGYKYHGRGYIQLSGKGKYRSAGESLDIDLINNPDLASQPENAAKIAILFWKSDVPVEARQNVTRAGGAINTGDPDKTPNHADRRLAKYEEWDRRLTPEIMERLSRGEVILPAATEERSVSDLDTQSIQQNIIALGITDARGRSLTADGDRGARTNEAIAAFQQEFGLGDAQLGNAELLTATQAALNANPYRRFGQETQTVSPEMLSQPQALGSFAPDPTVATTTAPPIAPRLGGSGRTRGTSDDDERQQAIDDDRARSNAIPPNASADQAMPIIPNPVQTRGPRDPRDPDDPNHAMNQSVREQVKALYAEHGANPTEQQLDQLTAGVMRDAKRSGMDQVKLIEFSVDPRTQQPNLNGNLVAYSGDPDDLVRTRWSKTDTQQAQQTAPERAYQDMDQATQQRTQQQAQFEQQQRDLNQNPDGPTMQR